MNSYLKHKVLTNIFSKQKNNWQINWKPTWLFPFKYLLFNSRANSILVCFYVFIHTLTSSILAPLSVASFHFECIRTQGNHRQRNLAWHRWGQALLSFLHNSRHPKAYTVYWLLSVHGRGLNWLHKFWTSLITFPS